MPPKKSEDSIKSITELKISDFIVKKMKPLQKNEVKINQSGSELPPKKKEIEIDRKESKECSNNTRIEKNLEMGDNEDKIKIGNKRNFILHKQ